MYGFFSAIASEPSQSAYFCRMKINFRGKLAEKARKLF